MRITFGTCKAVNSGNVLGSRKDISVRTVQGMAESSGGGPADKGPCKKCGETVEAATSGDLCAKCKGQPTEEGSGTHSAAGQQGSYQVTPGGAERGIREGTNDKEEVNKSMANKAGALKIAQPGEVAPASAATSTKGVSPTCNPGQGEVKQDSTATSTDSKAAEEGPEEVVVENPKTNQKEVSEEQEKEVQHHPLEHEAARTPESQVGTVAALREKFDRDKGGGKDKTKPHPHIEPSKPPSIHKTDVPGLCDKSRGIEVTLHVLLPFNLWGFEKQKSQVCVCFGHARLGDWKPITVLKCVGTVGGNLQEFSCSLWISGSILKGESCVPYKYYVTNQPKSWEFLHGVTTWGRGIVNRCLEVPTESFQIGGTFHQYDGIMYPEKPAKSFFATMRDFFVSSSSANEMRIPSHDEVQQQCLFVYLRSHKEKMLNREVTNIYTFTLSILSIFKQLLAPKVHCNSRTIIKKADGVTQAMNRWLLQVIKELKQVLHSPALENGKRMASVLSVILCFDYLIPTHIKMSTIKNENIADMLSMLTLYPDVKQRKCLDYIYVSSKIPFQVKKKLTEALLFFCNELHHRTYLSQPQWLYAVPLLHFLQGVSHPFRNPELDYHQMKWGDASLGLNQLRQHVHNGNIKLIEEHYFTLKPLLLADPMLLPVLVYICPRRQLPTLIEKMPVYVSVAWLSHLVDDKPRLDQFIKDVSYLTDEALKCLNRTTTQLKQPELESTLQASFQLLSNLVKKLNIISDDGLSGLKKAVSLALYSAHSLVLHGRPRSNDHKLSQAMMKIHTIVSGRVTGRFTKAFQIHCQNQTHYKMEELKIWNVMLQVDCPEATKQSWHNLITDALKERVNSVHPLCKIHLIFMLGSYKAAHRILKKVFVEALIERLQQLISDNHLEDVSNMLERINNQVPDKKIVVSILVHILKSKYPEGFLVVTPSECFKWPLWPTYLKIHSSFKYQSPKTSAKHVHFQQAISSELQPSYLKWIVPPSDEEALYITCSHVVVVLEEVYIRIVSGEITMKQLCKKEKQSKQLLELCKSASRDNEEQYLAVGTLLQHMEMHKLEYQKLTNRVDQLRLLISEVASYLKIERSEHLIEKLHANYEDVYIKRLCSADGNEHSLVQLLEETSPLESMLNGYICVAKTHANDIFDRVWQDQIKMLSARGTLSVADIRTKLWDPVIAKCTELLTTLQQCTITLAVVDEYFNQYQYRKEAVLTSMVNLYHGLSKHRTSSEGKEEDIQKIKEGVDLMQRYWSLCNYANAAKICLELKKGLGLTGDFQMVEILAKQDTASMKGQSLREVDHTLISTGRFLQEFATEDKFDCLTTYCNCMNIISWLKANTKDVTDLQNFVTVALNNASSGEDMLTNTKLATLRTVGSGFGYLIYDLKNDAGFDTLVRQCRLVWEAMVHTPNLPRYLEDCNSEVEWFKEVKSQQGSVKETSFGQMDACIKHGKYRVGQSGDKIFHVMSEVVYLTVEAKRTRVYTLDELKDLESKLVLITGSKDEKREKVDRFLDTFHSICEIAQVLMTLQQDGNVKYIGWSITVPCSPELIPELRKLHSLMQSELEDWKEAVRAARRQHYELNYFTTPQLLSLRQELGRSTSSLSIDLQVVALLQSISPHITMQSIKDAVQREIGEEAGSRQETDPQEQIIGSFQTAMNEGKETASSTPLPSRRQVKKKNREQQSDKAVQQDSSLEISENITPEEMKKKTILANIVGKYGERYRNLVLKALEEGKDDQFDIENCIEEMIQIPLEESEDDEDTSSEEEEEEEEDASSTLLEEESVQQNYDPSVSQIERQGSIPAEELHMITKEAIDISHPAVQELIGAGFDEKESITAIEKCGTAEDATDYLIAMRTQSTNLQPPDGSRTNRETEESRTLERSSEIWCYKKAEQRYLNLDELGNVLKILSSSHLAVIQQPRTFHSKLLKTGSPNLLVVPPDQVLKTALSLYMEDKTLPLPTFEEILICTQSTTSEEVDLLWHRAVEDPNLYRIFCLVHAENLPYQTSDQALKCLHEAIQGRKGYRLVIICGSDKEDSSLIVSKLSLSRTPYLPPQDLGRYQEYLRYHFEGRNSQKINGLQSCVRVVSSRRAGMGKTLYIQSMAEELTKIRTMSTVTVTVPIHGPSLLTDNLIETLKDYMDNQQCIVHLDIAPNVMWQLDTTLFSMLIQGGLSDTRGRVWRLHPSQMYAIEVTLTAKQVQLKEKNCKVLAVLELLPTVECVTPQRCLPLMKKATDDPSKVLMNATLFESSQYQRVYQYLRRHKAEQDLDNFEYMKNSVEGKATDCLQIFLSYCGVKDPSWAEIDHFVRFLEIQLRLCGESVFCKKAFVGDVLTGFKNFVVKFMIRMSRDFATSSLKGEVAEENDQSSSEDNELEQYKIVERKLWEQSSHPYIFFNQDGMSLTFVGFMVSPKGDLIDVCKHVLERAIMTKQLKEGLKYQGVDFEDNYQTWSKPKMVQKIATVMGLTHVHDPDKSYVLTVDNLLKILAIQMRFRCGIPVVVMGETGCGKTRLIRFMCDLAAQSSGKRNMLILKVHGGISEEDVRKFIMKAQKQATENKRDGLDTVVFFDEANTTDALGLIREIMCDRRMYGKRIPEDLKFIAACNPYRRHTDDMVRKLETAGLGFFVHADETQQKLGTIPLRNLVYRVQDLPPSMRPLVYDFGQLNTNQEAGYIEHIVSDHVQKHSGLSKCASGTVSAVSKVLSWSQKYMRKRKDECSFVSLRDVERAMLVFEYFYDKMDLFSPLMDKKIEEVTPVDKGEKYLTRSLILALSVCYHARLQERAEFERRIVSHFTAPLKLPGGEQQFKMEIRRCQEVLLDSMELGKNIARNTALRENVFMMAICIDLRIPLFLVGKPGSSKSLAKSVVSNSLNGKASKNELLRSFKEVHMFSYQCSQLSTSESIIKVFDTAKSFQKEDTTTFVSVVVLDEVGLAEDSPNLPLKALHPLLEDGTAGADRHEEEEDEEKEEEYSDEVIEREKRVAFIGISNWALDPAKMNRGVMVTRGDPDVEELELSARGICSTKERDEVRDYLQPYFRPLAEAYYAICNKQKRQFFGLRDFYSLIKMLYWMCEQSNMPPTGAQLRHAIKRNFGGIQEFSPYLEFKKRLPDTVSQAEMNLSQEIYDFRNPDCTPHGLIKASLRTKDTTWHGENRYLLFLTENYAALEVLKHYVHEPQPVYEPRPGEFPTQSHATPIPEVQQEVDPLDMEPFVLFGSSFPKDTEYTQVCRNINQIKICMETGRMVVLLNLHNLYESLYDLLNQYYIRYGDERYVDLGLQTHKLKCKVHKEFKLIMIAEKDTVYEKFPTPLINRLEKHFVLMSSVLTHKETRVMKELKRWIKVFSTVSSGVFQDRDAFVGYRDDTPAAVVFQANNQLQRLSQNQDLQSPEWTRFSDIFTEELTPEILLAERDDPDVWSTAVLSLSQYLLLCTASPAALVRVLNTDLSNQFNSLCQLYKGQHHSSISDFLHHHVQLSDSKSKLGLLMQVTTHSHLLSYDEVKEVQRALRYESGSVKSFLLQDFDTELHFSSKVGPLFKKSKDNKQCKLIIIQCDMGFITDDLVACARNRIYDMRAKAARECKTDEAVGTHVLFVVYLPVQTLHSSLVGFQGDPWVSAHIDEIRPTSDGTLTLDVALGVSISKLFYGPLEDGALGGVSEPPVLPEEPAKPGLVSPSISGPATQQIPSVAGPATQVIGSVPDPTAQVLEPVAGPTTQVIESAAGPTTQMISTVDGSTAEVLTGSTQEAMPAAPPKALHIPQAKQKRDIPRMYTQCRRLHICIQAAASRLVHLTTNKKWATKRVELLTDLIPSDPVFPIDENSFYGILVKHIHCLLQQRSATYGKTSNWVLNEAMDLRKLHIGGTFKNALARKIDDVVIPLFAEVIALVDHNYNLGHLKQLSIEQSPVQEFWIRMFSDPKVLQLNYSEIVGREKVPVLDDNFKCQLPFSWLIKEAVDNHWELAKSTSEKTLDLYNQLCFVFPETPVGEVLSSFDGHFASNDFLQRYIHDFLRIVHKCNHTDPKHVDKEYKLLQGALVNLAENSHFKEQAVLCFSSEEVQPTEERRKALTDKIIAVHVVYHSTEEHIHWFGQLTSYMPGILETLSPNQEQSQESPEMVLHLQALQEVLIILKPPIGKDETIIKQWLNHITVCQNAIDSILHLPSDHALAQSARISWQRIRVLQIFVEHVMMKHDDMVLFANRLDLHIRRDPNLLKSDTMKRMKKFLKSVNEDLKRKYKTKESKKKLHAITRSCDDFLIEVISSLCFGQQTAPEDELIEMLLNLIFTETEEESGSRVVTRELTLYRQKQDETPVIRSFLLQLLLGQNFEQLRKHLHNFFERSKQSVSAELNQELCLMCIQCFEDALVKRRSSASLDDQISACTGLLRNGQRAIKQVEPDISMEYLEGIASMRYALMVVAELLHRQPSTPIMIQHVPQVVTQPSKDMAEQEDTENEGQQSDSVEGREEDSTSQNGPEAEFQPFVPTESVEETERIEVEVVEPQPRGVTADKAQVLEQTSQPREGQQFDSVEGREEDSTSQSGPEAEFQPLVPTESVEETERIETEIVGSQPTEVTADKEQVVVQTAQPQDASESVEDSEEKPPEPTVSTEVRMIAAQTEVEEAQQSLKTSVLVDSDVDSVAEPATQLLLAAQSACRALNTAGPSHYLLKLIVRQFGFSFLRKLVKLHPWVIPKDLMWTGEGETTSDPFVIYGDLYNDLREAIGSATHSKQFTDLTKQTKNIQLDGTAFLLLGIYQKITLSRASKISSKVIPTEALQKMTAFTQSCKHLSEEMKLLAKRLVANEQGGPLSALCVSSDSSFEHQTLGGIVVHAVTVLLCRKKAGILHPFDRMLHDPSALVNAHLPTMPEGILPENKVAIAESGQFYECVNGHPIFVGECQRLTKATCSDCGARLKDVKLDPEMLKLETTYSGHCLGRPEECNPLPSAERSLSPAACSIVRAIMHSALVYVSCNNKTAIGGLLKMVKVEGIDPNELPEFFWGHLEKDLKTLAQAIGKSEDEAAIIVHLVLQQILTCEPPKSGQVKAAADLETPVMRNEWEKMFNTYYIQPILEDVTNKFRSAMKTIIEDSKQEHDPLLYVVYEHGSTTEKSLEPYLWTYRSRVTLEHLALLLQPQQHKYPILTEFLKQEPVLRATQYLPDIVRLQHHLRKMYHHRISGKEAQEKTIGQFLEEKFLSKEVLNSMATAWSLVKSKIRDHGRVKVERRFLDELTRISENTPLQYIIPTTTGPGACSLALVDYLVLLHNSFIEMCQGVVIGDDKSKLFWKAHRVPLPLIHRCHLLDYEQQLLSIVLSHCHYSLQVGQGQDVTYDLSALEKHILDRFIQGKPKIVSELQPVAYVKDLYIASNFSAVRMKVKQVELSAKVQEDILSDLVEIDQLSDSLDVVNILLGFLSTGGGRADSRLEDYLRKLRMEAKPISKMAKEHCRLEHILSLWKTLSVGLAKKMISRGQEPFDIDNSHLRALTKANKRALDECLRSFPDLDSLLGTMCEFVETYLRHNITEQQDWTLVHTMTAFLEQNQLEVPPQFADFPASILLSQTVATWKHIVVFQKAKQ